MPAKKQDAPKTVDDVNEPVESVDTPSQNEALWGAPSPELQALITSGIVTSGVEGVGVTWREGHLEHVAAQYKADPVRCEQVYHDDVTVAKAYSHEQWEALVGVG